MASEIALKKAAQAWCKPTTETKIMDPELAEAFAEVIDEYREALIWCGGSDDFGHGGRARKGWLKLVHPLLKGCKRQNKWNMPGEGGEV